MIKFPKSLLDNVFLFSGRNSSPFEFANTFKVDDFMPKLKLSTPFSFPNAATATPTIFPLLFIIGPPLLPLFKAASN